MANQIIQKLEELIGLIEQSYDPSTGCNWLKNKDFSDIAHYSLEEIYELVDAIESQDKGHIKEELADLVYHLLIYAELASRKDWFNLSDILEAALVKQKERKNWEQMHTLSAEQAHAYWQRQKLNKKENKVSLLSNIPVNMPAVLSAQKIQETVASVGFDWPDVSAVLVKLDEEVGELKQAIKSKNQADIQEELGDLLFTVINVARKCEANAEQCLRAANKKFTKRFNYIEQQALESGKNLAEINLSVLEQWWQQSKEH